MKIKQSFSLLALGTTLLAIPTWAQTTPTGAATSTTLPQGAITTDSMPAKPSREQKRAMKRNRRATNQKADTTGTTNTSSQDAAYRQSSASVGTAVNNSNTTNYNSNNVTNAPTGAGSNPNAMGASSTTPADQVSNGQNNSAARSSSSSTGAADSNAGTAAAVSGERNTKEPAVKSGSTERNTSIGDFVSSSPNFITLQNALQTADLWDMLKGSGPYTIFAPTNSAFKKLSSTAQGALLDGSNRDALKQLLSYHVVNESLSSAELARRAKAGNGKVQLKTVAGASLTLQASNGRITLTDEQGHTATVDATGNPQSNGMIYGIDSVLMPKSGVDAFK